MSGQNNIKVARFVERGHLVSTQLEAVLVEVSADIHQLLLALSVQLCVITCVPSQLEQIGVASQASNLVKQDIIKRTENSAKYYTANLTIINSFELQLSQVIST